MAKIRKPWVPLEGINQDIKAAIDAIVAADVDILHLAGATYETIQDFINATISSGRISGGEISDDLDGTITG
ncbi:unnamed protein product, partial [marine sediment metagenome]